MCVRSATTALAGVLLACPPQGGADSTSAGSTGAGTTAVDATTIEDDVTTTSTTAPTPTTGTTAAAPTTTTDTTTGGSTTTSGSTSTDASGNGSSAGSGSGSSTSGGDEVCGEGIVHHGDLVITDDTDLTSLACIVEVTGRLKISDTELLTSFAPLANLKKVGDDVQIFFNAALVDLDGLAGLVEVGGELPPAPFSFGEITVHGNPALVDITGLGSVKILDSLVIYDCDALSDLSGPQGPIVGREEKGWNLAIGENDALTSLDTLAIESFGDRLLLVDNPNLADISALTTIMDPAQVHVVEIVRNPALVDLVGLDAVTHGLNVRIFDNDALTDMQGLGDLEDVAQYLDIVGNDGLLGLQGLDQLAHVHIFSIAGNPALASLAGLDALTTVTHSLAIGSCPDAGNASLVDLHGLESLTTVMNLGVQSNASLTSLAGLEGLTSLDKLWAQFNPLLPSAEATALAAKFGVPSEICDNAGPPEPCICPEWMN